MNEQARIKVVGIGGAGCRVVSFLIETGHSNVELIAVNTDWACIRASDAHRRIELRGVSIYGLGSGGRPVWSEKCAEACANELREALSGCDLSLIVAGMGGGTGSGAAPVVARIAGETGALTIGIATTPLTVELCKRNCVAEEGLSMLCGAANAVIVVPCEELLAVTGRKIGIADFFAAMDRVLCEGIWSMIGLATGSKPADISFPGVKAIFRHGCRADGGKDGILKVIEGFFRMN